MTPFTKVYSVFLSKIKDDDWDDMSQLVSYEKSWREYLLSAIGYFKFPRISLKLADDEDNFVNDLSINEIQILAEYMKVEWLQSNIMTWENIKGEYSETDFSHANLLDKLDKTLKTTIDKAKKRESNYYRSEDGKPFDYTQLAGDGNGGKN